MYEVGIGVVPAFGFVICLDWRRMVLMARPSSGSVVPLQVTTVHIVFTGQMAGSGQ